MKSPLFRSAGLAFCLLMSACGAPESAPAGSADSLSVSSPDTARAAPADSSAADSLSPKRPSEKVLPEFKIPEVAPLEPIELPEKEDLPKPEIRQREETRNYNGGGLSVQITGTGMGMIYQLYNRRGEPSYRLESQANPGGMSSSVSLTYRADGSVAKAHINESPGASRYWYETDIHFDESNTPTYKTRQQMPIESINDLNAPTWLWDQRKGDWVKQEVVEEQPVPQNR